MKDLGYTVQLKHLAGETSATSDQVSVRSADGTVLCMNKNLQSNRNYQNIRSDCAKLAAAAHKAVQASQAKAKESAKKSDKRESSSSSSSSATAKAEERAAAAPSIKSKRKGSMLSKLGSSLRRMSLSSKSKSKAKAGS